MSKDTNILSNVEIKKIVLARLDVLPSDIAISIGSDGSFTRDQLIESVKKEDEIGEKMAEVQMEWLRSFKKRVAPA
ncbi:MAG: hypothetical protein WCT39_03550 [Candidatus Margulisiibacteriota bacterium]